MPLLMCAVRSTPRALNPGHGWGLGLDDFPPEACLRVESLAAVGSRSSTQVLGNS